MLFCLLVSQLHNDANDARVPDLKLRGWPYSYMLVSHPARLHIILLVFSVTPFKIDQNRDQNHSIDKVQNLGNERIEVHIQRPSPRFKSEEYFVYEIFEEMFYPNL